MPSLPSGAALHGRAWSDAMSFQAMAWAVQQKVGSSSAKFILLILSNYADNAGVCWPSQETLAADAEMTDRGIRKCVAFLAEKGLVSVEHRPGTGGGRSTNIYRLRLPERSSECREGNRNNIPPNGGQPEQNAGQPEPRSDKPIIEPIYNKKDAIRLVLEAVLKPETAAALIEHRAGKKAKLTEAAAKALVKQFEAYGDPERAVEEMLNRGWTGFKPDWAGPARSAARVTSLPLPTWRPNRGSG